MNKDTHKKSYKSLMLFGVIFLALAGIVTVAVGSGSIFRTALGTKITGDQVTALEWNDVIAQLPGEFIGFSANSNGTPGSGGYDQADSICNAAHAGSRVCSMDEMIRGVADGTTAWNETVVLGTPSLTPPASPQAWVSKGAPGDFAPVKDCDGWSDSTATEYGPIFSFYLEKALITECNNTIPFACCK